MGFFEGMGTVDVEFNAPRVLDRGHLVKSSLSSKQPYRKVGQRADKQPSEPRFIRPMNLRSLTLVCSVTASTFAADAPKLPIPMELIAKKKELLFSDDFERAELGKDKGWAIVVPTYTLENGAQMRSSGRRSLRRMPLASFTSARRFCGTLPRHSRGC